MGKNKGIRMRQIEEFISSGLDKQQIDLAGGSKKEVANALRMAIKAGNYPVDVCRRGNEVWLYRGDKKQLGLHRIGKWGRWIEDFLASGETFTVLTPPNVKSVAVTLHQNKKRHGYPIGISQSRDEIWVCRRKSNGTV